MLHSRNGNIYRINFTNRYQTDGMNIMPTKEDRHNIERAAALLYDPYLFLYM
jgi:hypothetical protein